MWLDEVQEGNVAMRDFLRGSSDRAGIADAGRSLCPPHPGMMHGICIRCGSVLEPVAEEHVALR